MLGLCQAWDKLIAPTPSSPLLVLIKYIVLHIKQIENNRNYRILYLYKLHPLHKIWKLLTMHAGFWSIENPNFLKNTIYFLTFGVEPILNVSFLAVPF